MHAAYYRIALTVFAALLGVALLFYSDQTVKDYFNQNRQVRNQLQTLQTHFYALDSEILKNGAFLYYSYDRINRLVRESEELFQSLRDSHALESSFHRKTRQQLIRIQRHFRRYAREIQRYLTINATLKNSAIYIPTLQLRAFRLFDSADDRDRETLLLLSRISATIFLARNAQDTDFLDEIRNYTQELDRRSSEYQGPKKRLLEAIRSHLSRFRSAFPAYVREFDQLMDAKLIHQMAQLLQTFQKEAKEEFSIINTITRSLLLLYLFSLGVVIYFILRTSRENRRLKALKEKLETALVTDTLTGLGNRLAFERTIPQVPHPALILVNIDQFKHINEFYGTRIGDGVLKAVARELERVTPPELEATLYRLGGDDFGILFSLERCSVPFEALVRDCHRRLDDYRIQIDKLLIDVSFSVGASRESGWLFETADMALKSAKSSPRIHYMLFRPELDKRSEISRNIQALRNIRQAINHESILPYFQPICHRASGTIRKFEALARIELGDGQVLQPYSFIRAANEAKLSGEITLKILEQTLRKARQYPLYHFSVNIGADDIAYSEDRKRILALLEAHQEVCPRLVFEILESEQIRDYESTREFLDRIKRFGSKIAIDDFGSGYSNFEQILKLDVDMLKVDGSLIRRIDHDRHSELVVRTILDFARHAGWETVAEFVHSHAVYEKVCELGFDYLQGYYIGKPSRELPDAKEHEKS